MSLRLKTILGIALIQSILLLLLVVMVLDYLRTTNYDGLDKRALTAARLFSTTVQEAVLATDLASLTALVDHVLDNPDLVYARVYGQENILLAAAGDQRLLETEFAADTDAAAVDDGVYDTFAEINVAGQTFGRVELGLDISGVSKNIREAQQHSALLAMVEMGLVALFAFILGSFLTRQLQGLTQAARSVSTGNLQIRLPVSGQDELSEVSAAFNAMARDLERASNRRDEYEQALHKLNLNLEERANQRARELQEKSQQLEQSNQNLSRVHSKLLHSEKMASLGVLAAGVAHEINNPISFIMSNLNTLEQYCMCYRRLIAEYQKLEQISDPQLQELQRERIAELAVEFDLEFMNDDIQSLLDDSIDGTRRVRDIVKGLRDFSHSGSDDDFSPTDLNDTIQSVLKVINNELKYHCEVRTELRDLPAVACREGQIRQVLLNLLLNAGQAIAERGIITVRSDYHDGRVEISIADTGSGISADALDKIFDPFYTTKPVGQGTGLGLAVSYGIAREHGGEIRVQSTPGEGSCFTLVLPLNAAEGASEARVNLNKA